jgi:hypothetical protein
MSSIDNNPPSYRFENTQAETFGYFDGQKKNRLILTDANNKVVKIAAERLDIATGERLFEKQQSSSKNWFTRHVVTKIGETWVKINIDSASKRLGIASQKIFECAKSNKFSDLLKQKSALNFQQDVQKKLQTPSDEKNNLRLQEIEDKTDELINLWSNRIQDISDPNKQGLNRDDCKRIVESVVLNQKELLAEASAHPNKTLYLREIKRVKLPRAVQIDADGSIFIHFNKSTHLTQ